ncbi:methylated-DNA--[protein]-cysteine S-methyltransferase, partial [Paracoccus sp. PXZ]
RTAVTDRTEAQITGYFAGDRAMFDLPLALHGTDFQQQVWRKLQRLPAGATISYAELARRIGRPSAIRAVARANGANQIAVVIPCHRVIGSDGGLTGYGGGLWRKQALIRHEAERFAP